MKPVYRDTYGARGLSGIGLWVLAYHQAILETKGARLISVSVVPSSSEPGRFDAALFFEREGGDIDAIDRVAGEHLDGAKP